MTDKVEENICTNAPPSKREAVEMLGIISSKVVFFDSSELLG